jgi:putative FmdB family regulatory protein
MPTYGYECGTCNEKFEVFQRITEDALSVHDGCGGSLRRLLYPVGIVFKGSGFYVNDYAKSEKKETSTKPGEGASETKTETKAEGTSEAKAETRSETTTEKAAESKPAPAAAKAD